jgi:hypothetical protein
VHNSKNNINDTIESNNNNVYFILPEYSIEIVYSDLLSKILTYDANLSNCPGLWRQ